MLLLWPRAMPADLTAEEMLTRAMVAGDLKTAESLLSVGLNPDVRDRYGRTPLINAVTFGETKLVQLLLAYHADPNAHVERPNASQLAETPLQAAAREGNLPVARMLIKAGAHVDVKGAEGRTALSSAAFVSHLDMMRFLIDNSADVNVRDASGASPLDDAAWRGNLDAVAMLLAHGAHLNEVNTQTGATPINEAAYRGQTAVVRYLLQFHPDVMTADKRGYGPLENAIRMGKEESALLLLKPDAKLPDDAVDIAIRKDEAGVLGAVLRGGMPANGAVDLAASAGAAKVMRVLLDHGADPNVRSRNGATALEDAALKGFGEIAGILLDHGAQVNLTNGDSGTTALYAAASFGKNEVVKMLLEHGANAGLCGKNGKSPYQAAVENGFTEVAALIREHGGSANCGR